MRILLILVPLILAACSSEKAPTRTDTAMLNVSQQPMITFKSGNSIGIAASKIDLELADRRLGRYELGTNQWDLKKEVQLTEVQQSSLSAKLKKLQLKDWGTCSNNCQGQTTIWIELPADSSFYFAYHGDCNCPGEENPGRLKYSEIEAVYSEITSALAN